MFCSQLRYQKHNNRQTKRLKTTVHINFILVGLFRIHLQLSFGHLLTFIRYVEVYSLYILRFRFWMVFVITRISLNRGSTVVAEVKVRGSNPTQYPSFLSFFFFVFVLVLLLFFLLNIYLLLSYQNYQRAALRFTYFQFLFISVIPLPSFANFLI